MELVVAGLSYIVSLVMSGVYILFNIFVGRFFYKKLQNSYGKIPVYVILLFFITPLAIIISLVIFSAKVNKEREDIYDSLTHSPNNENVDCLISFIDKYGCTNTPNAWHRLRGVWYACNKSSNITSDKKEQLLTYLLLKGLYLSNQERKIINN